jgi:acetyl/propionyl-CoA carboxylase alpha subunit
MLDKSFAPGRFHESRSRWIQSFSVQAIKVLIVCRGPVRKEAIDVFDAMGIAEYGMLLSEKDSIVYPKCLAPELRDFKFPRNVHRVPEYMGMTAEERPRRIQEIIEIAKTNKYTHIFAGYGFMAEDAEFIEAIEKSGVVFIGPSSNVAKRAGAKDEAKKLARSLGASVTPGVDAVTALALLRKAQDRAALEALAKQHGLAFAWSDASDLEGNAEALLQLSYAKRLELVDIADLQREAALRCEEIWAKFPGRRVRFKYIGGGGGKGQRVISAPGQVASAVMEILAESKVTAPGQNRNFLIELNIESTRHNEIQLIGNGQWCLSLGGRDCSVQMHEQKLLELSLTKELLEAEVARRRETDPVHADTLAGDLSTLVAMEAEAERFGGAVELNSVSTFESIVDGRSHFFMEMNTRIQVEHRVTEMVYRLKFVNPENPANVFYVDSLIEAMVLLAVHGTRVPKPERELRNVSGAEVRINATNQSLQPHAGGLIWSWSAPLAGEIRDDQGIGTRNPDTGAFVFYNLAGAYDSNIALVVNAGESRKDNLERLAEILRRTELRGYELQTNMEVHYGLISWILGNDPMVKPSTQFMASYLAAVGSLEKIIRDVDLEFAWQQTFGRHGPKARDVLRRKETLILRPIERLFSNGHVLGGFIGLEGGKLWRREGNDFVFASNPVHFLRELYHYLNLEYVPGKPASEQIWDHDDAVLKEAIRFYDRIAELTGVTDWTATQKLFQADHDARIGDAAKWNACVAAHRGFQAGLELLLMIPRIGRESGFLDVKIDERLEPVFPKIYVEPESRAELTKALSPAPVASSDEIVTPLGGHFYAREAPHLPPLIEEGQHFVKGQPLFVVEVMKMFNKVLAPFAGTVKRELMRDRDGQVIVKGQPIFKIAPDEVRLEESPEDRRKRHHTVTTRLMG